MTLLSCLVFTILFFIHIFMFLYIAYYIAIIAGQYRGTKVPRYFLGTGTAVLLWYRYRGTLLFFGGIGTLVLFYFLVGILRT